MPAKLQVPTYGYHGYLVTVQWFGMGDNEHPEYVWRRENEDYAKIQRYKLGVLDDLLDNIGANPNDFWKQYEEKINSACAIVSAEATKGFRKLIAERAYISELTSVSEDGVPSFDQRYDYFRPNNKIPTGEFWLAWDVIVSLSKSGALHFDIVYNYEKMSMLSSSGRGYPAHQTFDNYDYRQALQDVLNIPWSFETKDGFYKRVGYWQQAFDRECRTKYYDLFLDKCREFGVTD